MKAGATDRFGILAVAWMLSVCAYPTSSVPDLDPVPTLESDNARTEAVSTRETAGQSASQRDESGSSLPIPEHSPVTDAPEQRCPEGYSRELGAASLWELSIRQARERSLQDARLKAVEESCSIDIDSMRRYTRSSSGSSSVQRTWVETLGRVVDSQELSDRIYRPRGTEETSFYMYEITLCVKVKCEQTGSKDPYFTLKVAIKGPDGRNVTTLIEGDSFFIDVTPKRDAYLTILSAYFDSRGQGVVVQLYPNSLQRRPELVPAGRKFTFPPREPGDQGIALIAQLPEGKDKSDEELFVIGTKQWWPIAEGNSTRVAPVSGGQNFLVLESSTFEEWLERLHELPLGERTQQILPLTIVQR